MFIMKRFGLLLLATQVLLAVALNSQYEYLDPTKLQTKTSPSEQQDAATKIIQKYTNQFTVQVNPLLFSDKKDVFALKIVQGQLQIRASSGVAAVWGFHYYLKKYCKSHISWQSSNVNIPSPLPDVDEVVIANDRFRYYQNVCTVSYSFVWWDAEQWMNHVEWMAMNGINLALAPTAQEAAWARVYKNVGMTDDEIKEHFTGPAFLSWLRMGNLRGWGGPLLQSWHDRQKNIQDQVVDKMYKLGMVPIMPAFSGHVPRAFSRIYPHKTFLTVETWNKFESDYCCGLFLDPNDPLFKTIGSMYLREVTAGVPLSNVYNADPFNEISVKRWSTALVQNTSRAIYSAITDVDKKSVWLVQNWMFVNNAIFWTKNRAKSFLTAVPTGRMLVLDLQSEQWPQYDLHEMYYGQPFIWCMLHNFGGTLGMFGKMQTINRDVYTTRSKVNSTMIGVGLTPEGINQNYVVYDLMLESAWRKEPIKDLDEWVEDYAERRYGCNVTASAWRYLLRSVYSFTGLKTIAGNYAVTRRPSFKIQPWAWYKSHDLFEAFKQFATVSNKCNNDGFYHDLVDVTRQALQYRADQLYRSLLVTRFSNVWVFNATINQFLDVMNDMEQILRTNKDFIVKDWLSNARGVAADPSESYIYEANARNQITLWGPNGEVTDYACKQWAELFHYYYIPRWSTFLQAALDANIRNEKFDEKATQNVIRMTVEEKFMSVDIPNDPPRGNPAEIALMLYEKWANVPGLEDLPVIVTTNTQTTLADTASEEDDDYSPTVILLHSTTPVV